MVTFVHNRPHRRYVSFFPAPPAFNPPLPSSASPLSLYPLPSPVTIAPTSCHWSLTRTPSAALKKNKKSATKGGMRQNYAEHFKTPSKTPRPLASFTTIADAQIADVPARKRKGKEREHVSRPRHTSESPTPATDPIGFEDTPTGVALNDFGGFPDEDPADKRAAFDDDLDEDTNIWRPGYDSDNDIRPLTRASPSAAGTSSSSKKVRWPCFTRTTTR